MPTPGSHDGIGKLIWLGSGVGELISLGSGVDEPSEAAGATLPAGSAAHIYPGMKHWFMEPDRPEFDADATELAYRRTVEFLRANLT